MWFYRIENSFHGRSSTSPVDTMPVTSAISTPLQVDLNHWHLAWKFSFGLSNDLGLAFSTVDPMILDEKILSESETVLNYLDLACAFFCVPFRCS